MKFCECCRLEWRNEDYCFCPYCGAHLVEITWEEDSWYRDGDKIAENGVRIEPHTSDARYDDRREPLTSDASYGYEIL